MTPDSSSSSRNRSFRHFFFRGLGIVLPTVLTIWILVLVYQFVSENIAQPINTGVQHFVVWATPWPAATENDFSVADDRVANDPEYARERAEWRAIEKQLQAEFNGPQRWEAVREGFRHEWLTPYARQAAMERMWTSLKIGNFVVLDVVGLLIAAILIYIIGALVGSYVGGWVVARSEVFFRNLPLIRLIYPHVKQVTEFFFGETHGKMQFNKVVAVQYPRKGLWSLGLVTGDTLRLIEDEAGTECVTIFVPSSPTPFTGYVITVPKVDTIELPISIDDALRFTISGGVIVPDSQMIHRRLSDGDKTPQTPGKPLPAGPPVAKSTE